MNLIILHGNGLVGLLARLTQIKKQFDPLSITEINAKESQLALLDLGTQQLFTRKRLVILENTDSEFDITQLPKGDQELTLVLRFSKALTANSKILKEAVLRKAQVIQITEQEVSIFPFLDKLAEKKTDTLKELDKLYENYGSQYILTMISYMLRRLVVTPKKLPPFVLQKMENQKRNFPTYKITKAYTEVLETDYKIKNGLMDDKIGVTLLVHKLLAL